jgi:hypothetical protein
MVLKPCFPLLHLIKGILNFSAIEQTPVAILGSFMHIISHVKGIVFDNLMQ